MAVRMDPCLSAACRSLNFRDEGTPAPERCPKCGGPVLIPPVRVGPNLERELAGKGAFDESQIGGVFDGMTVTSDADEGM